MYDVCMDQTNIQEMDRIFTTFDLESIIRSAFERYFDIECQETKNQNIFCSISIRKSVFDKKKTSATFTIPYEKRDDPEYTHSIVKSSIHGLIQKML